MVNAVDFRAPRSSARIDPVARIVFDIAKPLLRPDPAPQQQTVDLPLALICDAMSGRFLRSVSLL